MKINLISAFGDPRSPKTWSGTTYNVSQALLEQHGLEGAYTASTNNIIFKVAMQLLRLYYKLRFYKGKNHMMMPFRFTWWRYLSAYSASNFLKKSSSKNMLHFSTLSLPLPNDTKQENHYCLIDATWNIWLNNATNIDLIEPKDRDIIQSLDYKTFQQVKHIFPISEYVKQNLIKYYNIPESKITVVGTGTGIIQPYFGKKDYRNGKILFVAKGRFNDKGGDLVLKTFDILLKKYPNLELSIVGQNDYSSSIQHPNIKTYGFIDLNELQVIFNSCSLFIMPALNEPWGLVYIEAMLCRMPIIGLNKNSFPELSNNGEFGIGVDIPDPAILSSKISELLERPELMESIGNSAQQFAIKNYTWTNVASKILSVIESTQN
jgi:glycosyltransferase involved in cell wall biosynthesis